MEKYGVHINIDSHTKIASKGCPVCGGKVDTRYMTPRCDNCGTAPWEHNGKKEERKTKRR